jgi:hypothetical protein
MRRFCITNVYFTCSDMQKQASQQAPPMDERTVSSRSFGSSEPINYHRESRERGQPKADGNRCDNPYAASTCIALPLS